MKYYYVHLTTHDGVSNSKVKTGKKDKEKDKAPLKVNKCVCQKKISFISARRIDTLKRIVLKGRCGSKTKVYFIFP